jgi:hypothetical protein
MKACLQVRNAFGHVSSPSVSLLLQLLEENYFAFAISSLSVSNYICKPDLLTKFFRRVIFLKGTVLRDKFGIWVICIPLRKQGFMAGLLFHPRDVLLTHVPIWVIIKLRETKGEPRVNIL